MHPTLKPMKVATWNVNSIRARLPLVLKWLEEAAPDVVLFQETKVQDEAFPFQEFEHLPYNVQVFGQKTYNGIAIFSKFTLEDVVCGLPTLEGKDPLCQEARYLQAFTGGMQVASIYVPNGQAVGHEKYEAKHRFMKALTQHVGNLFHQEVPLILGGDFNITPGDCDVYDAKAWREKILCSTPERQWLRELVYQGFTDPLQIHLDPAPEKNVFTWWDYRSGGWERGDGLRIDHLLLSPQACDRLAEAGVDQHVRGWDKTSDHAPVWAVFS
ncbi:MAG: exodeoxyribonuclease III [Alphaproteobacteria bacterium]